MNSKINDSYLNLKGIEQKAGKLLNELGRSISTAPIPEKEKAFFSDAFGNIQVANAKNNDKSGLDQLRFKLENIAKANPQ